MKKFQGIFTVVPTFYDKTGGIDHPALERLTRHQIDSGVHGLVVLGSNGECPYLTPKLQKSAMETVIRTCAGALPVIVGINERGTEAALETAHYARNAGAGGLLLALPVFYPLDQEAVYRHYETVCNQADLPVLYYNFPSHSHLVLSPEEIARMARIKNMIGAKETIFKTSEMKALVDATNEDFSVFTGTCLNLTKTMGVGVCGAICPLPNVAPQTAVRLYEALKARDAEKSAPLQAEINKLMPLLAGSPTPHALMKEALRLLGHPVRVEVKSPLPQLTPEQAVLVKDTLVQAGLLAG
ncbi:MAG: dihydrodipicolinate synthase family protein [Deltaproteobacteria bacterium]|nr:dihydrodipicolinate synthase family protein [Deltaproteobacteria bacterium]